MYTGTFESDAVRFPNRCAGCGGDASTSIAIDAFRGIDLVAFRFGRQCSIALPACHRCRRSRFVGRSLWVMLTTGVILFVCLLSAAAFRNDGPETDRGDLWMTTCVLVLGALLLVARARALEWYDRLFAPVWFLRIELGTTSLTLGFRQHLLARDVALLAGKPFPDDVESSTDYRSPAARMPDAWTPPLRRTGPWWLPAFVGIAALFGTCARDLARFGRREPTEGWLLETVAIAAAVLVVVSVVWRAYLSGSAWVLAIQRAVARLHDPRR